MLRAMWTGTINFGLLQIPVKAYKVAQPHDLKSNHLHGADYGRVNFTRVCGTCGETLEFSELVNGYPVGGSEERYVVVSDADRKAVAGDNAKALTLDAFVAEDDVDPAVLESAYLLAPDRGGAAAYAVLLNAMAGCTANGVGTVYMRDRAYLALLRPGHGALYMHTLLYRDEVLMPADVESLREPVLPTDEQLVNAAKLIQAQTKDWALVYPEKRDVFRDGLANLLESRAAGDAIVTSSAPSSDSGQLLQALEASVKAATKPARRSRAKTAS